jgi:hypothetical protein
MCLKYSWVCRFKIKLLTETQVQLLRIYQSVRLVDESNQPVFSLFFINLAFLRRIQTVHVTFVKINKFSVFKFVSFTL